VPDVFAGRALTDWHEKLLIHLLHFLLNLSFWKQEENSCSCPPGLCAGENLHQSEEKWNGKENTLSFSHTNYASI
jgi:hypothetical protein